VCDDLGKHLAIFDQTESFPIVKGYSMANEVAKQVRLGRSQRATEPSEPSVARPTNHLQSARIHRFSIRSIPPPRIRTRSAGLDSGGRVLISHSEFRFLSSGANAIGDPPENG
jgi:hypothetical protein